MRGILDRTLLLIERYLRTDARYLASGSMWLSFGQGVSAALSLATAFAFANWIPKETYGTYKYILAMVSIFTIASLTDMATAIVQSAAKGEVGGYLFALRTKMRWGIWGCFAAIVAAAYYLLNGNMTLGMAFLISAPFVPLLDTLALWGSYLGGKKLFKETTLLNMRVQGGISLSVLGALFFSNNVVTIVTVYLCASLSFLYLGHRSSIRRHPEMLAKGDARETIAFGKNLSFRNIIGNVSSQLDSFLLWHFLDPIQLANYAFALATTNPAKRYMKTVFSLAQPKFSTTGTATLQATIHQKVLRSFLLFIPITFLYIIILPPAFQLLFPKYLESVAYAQVMGLIFLFFPFKLYWAAIVTRDDKRATYKLVTFGPVARIFLLLALVPYFGVWGAVWTALMSYAGSSIASWYLFMEYKEHPVDIPS